MKRLLLIVLSLLLIVGCSKPDNEIMFGLAVVDIGSFLINLADKTDEKIEKVIFNAQEKGPNAISIGFDFIDVFKYEVIKGKIILSEYYHGYGNTNDEILNNLRIKTDNVINQVVEILKDRLDKSGVAGYTIRRELQYRIIIGLAGVKDVDRLRNLLTTRGLLRFYLAQNANSTNELIKKLDDVEVQTNELWDDGDDWIMDTTRCVKYYRYYSMYCVENNPKMTEKFIKKASPDFSSLDGNEPKQAMVSIKLNSEGSKIWSNVTRDNMNQQIIVSLDDKVLMNYKIRTKYYSGGIKIGGFSDINEAKDLSIILTTGPLPISTVMFEEKSFAEYKKLRKEDNTESFVKRPFSEIYEIFAEDNESTTVSELFAEDNESTTVSELFGGDEAVSYSKGLFSSMIRPLQGNMIIHQRHFYKFKTLLSNNDNQRILNNFNSRLLLSQNSDEIIDYEDSFVGKYVGSNNYGYESIITVRSNGKYTKICRDMGSYLDGQWKKESCSRIAFYADNGFGGMDKTLSARISSSGLQVDGGNFYRRK